MSEENTHEQPNLDTAGNGLDTFEMSTTEIVTTPADSLLAQYADPISCDPPSLIVEPAVAEELGVVEQAVVEQPTAEEPVVEPPAAEQPVVEEAVTEQPIIEQPIIEQPVVEEVAVEQPAAEQPVAEEVVAEQPITVEPVVEQPTVEQPVAAKAVAAKPVVEQPEAAKPVAEKTTEGTKEKSSGEQTFRDLALLPEVQQAVAREGYDKPTDIQAQIIPYMLDGRDVLAQSQTGTGKTAAFALPILSRINVQQHAPQVLVLAPTRELAIQVAKSFATYGKDVRDFRTVAIYGGQDYEAQFRALRRGVQVVVGTPGRVIDHVNRGSLDLSQIQCLVLDEADEMLNMGFLEDVQFVLDKTPDERQVALFSATLPGPIRSIAQRYLTDPAKITIKNKTMTADSIRQRAVFVTARDKMDVLTRILEIDQTDGVIVFTKTREATVNVAEQLNRQGFSAVALNGDMPQKVRERTIAQLKSGQLDILVATDVAARGLDVPRISHVFNFDLPHDSESYVHRIGRTGRAGRKGEAIIFLSKTQRGRLRMIERTTKQPIEIIQAPTTKEINLARVERFKQRITDVTADQDLSMFKQIIAEYAEETGKPMDMIAAALAEIAQQGRPFMMKDQPKPKKREREDRNRGDYDNRPQRGGNRPGGRRLGPPAAGMTRYRIEVGDRDGVSPGNIVGAIANEAGIQGNFIGPISIQDSFSTVDLPEGMPRDVYQTLRNTWVSGKQLRIRYVAPEDGDQRPRRTNHQGTRPHHAKSGGHSSGGGHAKKSFSHGKPPFAGKKKKRKNKA
ncbi:DEAD/DEAH box helicase [Roseimaritima ulvae]|uniref:ATP-dependent RNA helicase DeaD n=1 Tax=Roseimaritima ulvae TaxID=980254 RepID=A0A5B9QWN8_9BACT|nr:DEAD/DEAH box helicase [Roseimaritima ulvae]QEG38363.1 ATP-dependent RNA helicase DeaD [Roseimaritima ulvae]